MKKLFGIIWVKMSNLMSNLKERILGLDYGDRTIGVAVSDPLGIMALGVETIRREKENALRASFRRLQVLIDEYTVGTIVLGLPKNMNNTMGERCTKTLAFKEQLEKKIYGVPVIMWDERLSTAGARRTLSKKFSGASEKAVIDEMAAVYILQGYMDFAAHKIKEAEHNDNGI